MIQGMFFIFSNEFLVDVVGRWRVDRMLWMVQPYYVPNVENLLIFSKLFFLPVFDYYLLYCVCMCVCARATARDSLSSRLNIGVQCKWKSVFY